MAVDEDGEDPPGDLKRKSARRDTLNNANEDFYKPYTKPGYKRVFPENAVSSDYTVFVESTKDDKIGNSNPLLMANLFKSDIKGVSNIKRINAGKIAVIFSQARNANNFLKNEDFLTKNNFKTYIPARAVERIGVLRFVPTSITNEELFKKATSTYEIISVRRFTKRVEGIVKPFNSVSITFLANSLPEYVCLDLYTFKVYEYVAPLLQCYKCFKFNHGAKICKSVQKCSICSCEHHFSECKGDAVQKCINCGGSHLAISRDCPIKKAKMEEKNNRVRMVVSETPGPAEVILVLECTAVNGAYINELKTNYILPALEYFHGGSSEDGGSGLAVYGAVVCRASDCHPGLPATTLGPYTCPQHLLNAIDKLQFVGGRGESHVCLAEGLSVALLCLEEMGRADAARHVLLLCCSPPYSAAAGGVSGYGGSATAEQAAKALGDRGANVSIVAPRKIPSLLRLFEHAGGDLAAAQARNYAKDPRHLVLLRGFSLKERPPSPAPPPALAPEQTQTVPPQESLPMHPAHPAYRQQVPPRPQPPQQFTQTPQYTRGPGMWRMPQQAQRQPYPTNSVLLNQLAQPSYPPSTQNMSTQQAPPVVPRMPMLGSGPGPVQQAPVPSQPQPPQPTAGPPMAGAGPSAGVPGPSAPTVPGSQPPAPPQRTYIWQGILEWMEKGKGPGDQQKVTKHLPCQVSSNSKDVEPDLKADTWPNKLLMQLMPKQLIGNIGGQYLKDSKSVLFHLQQNEALESLTKVMVNGFAGCVHFQPMSPTPPCDIKVLILLYTADKKAYLGFIPNNQATFVERLRKVIQQQKFTQMLNKQMPGGGGPGGPGAGPSQALVPPQQMPQQMPQGNMMLPGMSGGSVPVGGGKGVPRAPQRPLDDLEAARQQNLEKIQHLQQTLEAAQQQEAQYRSQMDIMSHLQAAQQQEQQFKQLDEQRKQQQLQMQQQLQQRGGPAPHMGQQPQQRIMRPIMASNPGLRHLLQQQPQYRPGGSQARPPSQPQQFDDVPNYNDFL